VIGQHYKRREIFIFAPESIGNPRTCAREAGKAESRRLQESALTVDSGFAYKVVNKGKVVYDITEGGDDLTQHLATFAVGTESPGTTETGSGSALE